MKSISRILLVTFLMIVIGAGLFALSSCDDFLENTLPHEHVWGEWNIVEESTCAEEGIIELCCSICGHVESMEYAKKEHVAGDWTLSPEATCTKPGLRVIKCQNCDLVMKAETIPAKGHTMSDWIVDSELTCTENGVMHRSCSTCGEVEEKISHTKGHSVTDWTITSEPTCTEDGEERGTCSTCQETIVKSIPQTGHFESEWIIDSYPTCTEDGKRYTSCTVCGVMIKEENLKSGHQYVDGKCIICGYGINSEGVKIEFDFGEKGEEKHVDPWLLDEDAVFVSNNYTLKFTDTYKIFGIAYDAKGNSCIKIGTGSDIGSLTFEVPNEVTAVIIRIAKYKVKDSDVVINGILCSLTKNSNDGEYNEFIIDTSKTKTVTITTVAKNYRAMIDSITYIIGSDSSECDHKIETIPSVSATCTTTGLTEGKKCSVCGEVLVAQEVVPVVSHNYVDGNCEMCGVTSEEYFVFTLLEDGTYSIVAKNVENMPSKVVIPSVYNGKPVTVIGDHAFEQCSTLTEVIIPNSITYIGDYAFHFCIYLTEVVIPNSITTINDYTFAYCVSLTSVVIPDSITSIGVEAFSWCQITNLVIPDSVTTIGDYAFYFDISLTSIVIGKSVTEIGENAFTYYHLDVVYNNSDLQIELGSESYGGVAYNAKILVNKGVIIYANNGYNYTLTNDGFLFREQGSKYELISYVGGEDTVTLPRDINGHSYTLDYMHGIKHIIIPDSFTTINDYAFHDAFDLRSIVIPDSVTSIGHAAFSDSGITSIVIPDSVTSIGERAFWGCDRLTNVVIGNSVTSIGYSAFEVCDNLAKVYYNGGVTEWNNIYIYEYGNSCLTNATRYYYSESQPTTEGNFWHWVDGEPTVWEIHVHTEEIIPAVAPTCTSTGLTEGKKCSECGEVLVAQEVVPVVSHNYVDGKCVLCGYEVVVYDITLLVPYEDMKAHIEGMIEEYMSENPGIIFNYTVNYVPDSTYRIDEICNPSSNVDLHYEFFDNTIIKIIKSGALMPLSSNASDIVKSTNSAASLRALTLDGTVYAYPLTEHNGYYLYYDKSIITNPQSLEQIIADCEAAKKNFNFELSNPWYMTSFFHGTGCYPVGVLMKTDNSWGLTTPIILPKDL